jgi:beta-carotene/zeaxanthin 4-ketolase
MYSKDLIQHRHKLWGVFSAVITLGLWLLTFILVCQIDIGDLPLWAIATLILGRTFLHTGLFIISHDAAHGTVFTPNRFINDKIGAISLVIYGLLPYNKFLINHALHHLHPASAQDPDFHDGKHSHIIQWYVRFMSCYLDKRQNTILFFGMTFLFHGIRLGFGVSAVNLLLFWILPLLLSSVQLFYFGTFLPHRQGINSISSDRHRAVSSNFPLLISFFTCYHFGYHWEHHEYPHLPWFKLPTARSRNLHNPL